MKHKNPILCLDFDGVIHSYSSGWKGARIIPDPPVPGVGAFLLKAVQVFNVAIFSSRSHRWGGRRAMRRYVRDIIWEACLSAPDDMAKAWSAGEGLPEEYMPWTLYDVRDTADYINRRIAYPLFKPAAAVTIDDRAITFNGDWTSYDPKDLKGFRPYEAGRSVEGCRSLRPAKRRGVARIGSMGCERADADCLRLGRARWKEQPSNRADAASWGAFGLSRAHERRATAPSAVCARRSAVGGLPMTDHAWQPGQRAILDRRQIVTIDRASPQLSATCWATPMSDDCGRP